VAPVLRSDAKMVSCLTATVPRILATILNGTIVAGMVVLLHRCRTARLIPAAHLHISYAKDIFAPVYDSFTEGLYDSGMRTMRTALDSRPQHLRLFAGGGRAREIRP
jgi:hypothetical protein